MQHKAILPEQLNMGLVKTLTVFFTFIMLLNHSSQAGVVDVWAIGDGILFYPGRMPHQPEEDRGLNLAMPSIKLKNIRRGQQDYELLWLVEQKVGIEKAKTFAREVVIKAMSEVEMTDPVAWSQKGDDYDKIRDQLLDILKNK